jgi:hypothetical protein
METYIPIRSSFRLSARVSKETTDGVTYRIVASFACTNSVGCNPTVRDTLAAFNEQLNAIHVQDQTQ